MTMTMKTSLTLLAAADLFVLVGSTTVARIFPVAAPVRRLNKTCTSIAHCLDEMASMDHTYSVVIDKTCEAECNGH